MIDLRNLPLLPKGDPIRIDLLDGYRLAAPQSFWQAGTEQVNSLVNGCGPGGFGDRLVPDTVWFLSIKPACKIHDWMFLVYNCEAGFDLANTVFKDNMARINQTTKQVWLKYLRTKRIKKYYWICAFSGRLFYYDAHLGVYENDEVYFMTETDMVK